MFTVQKRLQVTSVIKLRRIVLQRRYLILFCVRRKFAPRCCVCSEPIMPAPGQEETVRIVALDRDFHVQCYRCEVCPPCPPCSLCVDRKPFNERGLLCTALPCEGASSVPVPRVTFPARSQSSLSHLPGNSSPSPLCKVYRPT